MEFVRQVIDSNVLGQIPLPKSLRNRKVEIIILPYDETIENPEEGKSIADFVGIFSKYKNPDLIPLEKEAWAMAMEEKHGNH
ncbi:MAG: hypothetical protein FWF44_00180 [Defluviitaleaceae bacterium]|nr:hypothetical protein [Defluviitaleaceae bacterium]